MFSALGLAYVAMCLTSGGSMGAAAGLGMLTAGLLLIFGLCIRRLWQFNVLVLVLFVLLVGTLVALLVLTGPEDGDGRLIFALVLGVALVGSLPWVFSFEGRVCVRLLFVLALGTFVTLLALTGPADGDGYLVAGLAVVTAVLFLNRGVAGD